MIFREVKTVAYKPQSQLSDPGLELPTSDSCNRNVSFPLHNRTPHYLTAAAALPTTWNNHFLVLHTKPICSTGKDDSDGRNQKVI